MDYGHANKTNLPKDFGLTPGVGNVSPELNPLPEDNNLNSDLWGNAAPSLADHPAESAAHLVPESAINSAIISENPVLDDSGELGVITPINAPQNAPVAQPVAIATVRTDGDHIAKSSLREVEHLVNKFEQNNLSLSNFYNTIRGEHGAMQQNLENSYNRKLAV